MILIMMRGKEGGGKTLKKLSKTPQTLHIVKQQAHVNPHA